MKFNDKRKTRELRKLAEELDGTADARKFLEERIKGKSNDKIPKVEE